MLADAFNMFGHTFYWRYFLNVFTVQLCNNGSILFLFDVKPSVTLARAHSISILCARAPPFACHTLKANSWASTKKTQNKTPLPPCCTLPGNCSCMSSHPRHRLSSRYCHTSHTNHCLHGMGTSFNTGPQHQRTPPCTHCHRCCRQRHKHGQSLPDRRSLLHKGTLPCNQPLCRCTVQGICYCSRIRPFRKPACGLGGIHNWGLVRPPN